jgi:TonB-linked SusC/RagA family outer membrane protein
MRTFLFLFCTTLFALTPDSVLSQNSKITIKENKTMSVDEVFDLIMEQTDYKFFYEEGIFKNFPKVQVKKGIINANKLLKESLQDANIDITIGANNSVIIKEKPKTHTVIQQKFKVSGKVTDNKGLPLPGANVLEKATKKGVQADINGNYSIEVSDKNAKLEFSFIGFITKEIPVNGATELNVVLVEDASALDEVVVVGYGTTKKSNLTGGVAQITSKQIENFIAPNLGQMLQGVSPGLNVTLGSGDINAEANLNIRGINSINGGGPLVLVDGVEGNINKINPNDVESVSVLKDASSAAIYGARAAYGVILINTKKGKDGKLKVSYNTNLNWSKPTIRTDNFITNGLQWARLSDKLSLLENTSTYLGLTQEDYDYLDARELDQSLPSVLIKNVNGAERYIHYGNTDWWNTLFSNNQASQEHNFSLSGGTDKVNVYLSGRFYTREGIYKINEDVLDTKTFRVRVNAKPANWLEVGNNINVSIKDYTHPATNTRFLSGSDNSEDWRKYTFHAAPLFLPRNPDGSIIIKGAYTGTRDIADGTFADLINGKSKGEENDLEVLNTTNATINISKNLKLKTDYSFRQRYQSEWVRIISTPYTNQPNGEGVSLFKEDTQIYKELERKTLYQAFNAYADYVWHPMKNHTLTALVGFNQEWNSFKRNIASRNGNLSEELNSFNLASGENVFLGSTENEWAIRGVFHRIKYDINEKYLFEINGRVDLTSRFPTENRTGFFPSGSVGWKISSENFWENIKPYIGSFKLRASFGALGNEKSVSEYRYLETMGLNQGGYIADGVLPNYYTTPQPAVRTNFTWESTETLNLGVDISALKNRFNLTFDKYRRNTFNMLVGGKVLPSVFGAPSPVENSANLTTKGFELSLDWKDDFKIAGKPFKYNLGFVLSDSRTHITRFDNPTGGVSAYNVGEEIGQMWGYTVEGFFQTDDEYLSHANQQLVSGRIYENYLINHPIAGDIKFADLDGNGVISQGDGTLSNPGDLKKIGNSNARYNYGITLGAEFAGFDLNVFAQGIMQRDWNPGTDNGMFWGPFSRQYQNFYPESIESMSWTPDNPNAYFPRLAPYSDRGGAFVGSQLRVNSDKYLQNAAYLRIKNITLGYNIPKKWVNMLKLDKIRLYATGMNLFTFSPLYKNNPDRTIDPEQLGDGNDYPFTKTYAFGLDIKF